MNTTTNTTQAIEVKAIEVIYTVKAARHGEHRVTVSTSGDYECKCGSFALYGECAHTDAVKAQRKTEGRKF